MTPLDDYGHYDDDHLLTEKEVIEITMGELGVSRKQPSDILKRQ